MGYHFFGDCDVQRSIQRDSAGSGWLSVFSSFSSLLRRAFLLVDFRVFFNPHVLTSPFLWRKTIIN